MTDMAGRNGAATRLRAGLLLLVAMGVAGTGLALAYERHWLSPWQLAPWIVIGIVGVATVALVVRQTAFTVRLARAVAVAAIVSAVLGTWQHVDANLNPDPDAHQHAAPGERATTSDQASDNDEAAEGDDHHADEKSESGDHHADEKSEGDDHHADQKSSSGEAQDSEEMEATSPSPSFVDVVIGAVGHAPVPAALSLAPIGLALGLATIGLGGSRTASKE